MTSIQLRSLSVSRSMPVPAPGLATLPPGPTIWMVRGACATVLPAWSCQPSAVNVIVTAPTW